MEITSHLNEVELAEFVCDNSGNLGTHLAYCDFCLNKVARMREIVAGMRAVGVEPDEFWIGQRDSIRTKIARRKLARTPMGAAPGPSPWRWSGLTWAGAAAVLVLAGLFVSGGTAPPPTPGATTPQAANDPDHELLLAVERVMQSSGPEALEPAAFLVREVSRKAQPRPTSKTHRRNSPSQNSLQGDSQ
jgi:hypothetical protein